MSDADKRRWNERYAAGEYAGRLHPTGVLAEWLHRLPRIQALDVATGTGRNAIFLAQKGYQVDAVDISEVALQRGEQRAEALGVKVNWIATDLDDTTLPRDGYNLIIAARFLNRSLFPVLIDALAQGGHLVYETHLMTHAPVSGPRGPYFRVRPQELLHLTHELRTLHYFEGLHDEPGGTRMALAQVIACKGTPGF